MISKILLINTPRISKEELAGASVEKQSREVYPPLGLLYLSASLKNELKNVQVEVFDLHFESIKTSCCGIAVNWIAMCEEKIKNYKPDLIGFSVLFGASFPYAEEITSSIKKNHPEIPLVAGGIHITGIAKENGQLDAYDFISLYESEYHFVGLIKYLNNQQYTLKGIIVKNGRFLRNDKDVLLDIQRPQDLDQLPIPDFSAIDLRHYYKYGALSGSQIVSDTPIATLLTSRGCNANCKFCSVRSFMGQKIRAHSSDRVLKEIDILYNDFNIRHIDFVDDDLTHNKKRFIQLFEGLIRKQYSLTWSVGNGLRLGTLDEEILEIMVRSGCIYISVGIETADPEILKEMRKPLTIPLLKEKVKLLRKFPQIYYRANFMIGFPGETLEQMEKTFSLAEEISLDWSLFSMCKPLPNTELYQENKKGIPQSDGDTSTDYRFNTSRGVLADWKGEASLVDFVYDYNLKINFRDNKNLAGRNIERAIKDFERITRIAKEHAFAWNCLAVGYKILHRWEDSAKAAQMTHKIVNESPYWKNKFKDLSFPIES